MLDQKLLDRVRDRFSHVDSCPFQGERVFFENAGGALTLKSVVDASALHAAIPDNQGRDNPASAALMDIIATAKKDMLDYFGTDNGVVFVGESGTEVLFRLIRTAARGAPAGGIVLGSTLEHPATSSASSQWSEETGREHRKIAHDNSTGSVSVDAYRAAMSADVRIATIIHTSPVTGMSVDVAGIAKAIREVSPDCIIVVDGIQHAAHGAVDLGDCPIDGYAISPYKVFSRHGYGIGWASDRLSALPHEKLNGTPDEQWELGTRDTGAYATFSCVVDYLDWLGSQVSNLTDRRERLVAAAQAIAAHEHSLVKLMIHGDDTHTGLAQLPKVSMIGGVDNPLREGLVAMNVDGVAAADVVTALSARGVRTHVRKADHYSGNVLVPLELEACVRVSMCHYNSAAEVRHFLAAMAEIAR